MRHRNKKIKLGRKRAHRSSMLANLACSLIEHKRINTTVTKAKALKRFIEPLVTKTKDDSTHNRRVVFKYLRNKQSINELFRTISNKIGDRPGGYTRIIKLGKRLGDNADMAMIEFVDFNELYSNLDKTKKTTRRSRSKSKGKATEKEDNKSSEKQDNKPSEKADSKALEKEDKKDPEKRDDKATEKEDNKSSEKADSKALEKEDKKDTEKGDNKATEKEDEKTSEK
tara:strand:+ start:269 stop:949 length:681 start_codon:yes stop_codon:yes gene_type:complete